jgi:hypothetical protein
MPAYEKEDEEKKQKWFLPRKAGEVLGESPLLG